MRALVLTDYNQLKLQDVPEPVIGPDDVLIRVGACGICGSDIHGMDGSTGRRKPPIIMGHEAAGAIATVGKGLTGWAVGDRVTFDSTLYCGECPNCLDGRINLCDRRRVLGVSCDEYRQHGAFAEYLSVPARVLYKVPDAVSTEHAAMVEPVSVAAHAVSRLSVSNSGVAVVIGSGMIGLLLVQVLRAVGWNRIAAVDTQADRLELAKRFGANWIVNAGMERVIDVIDSITGGNGADAVFEVVGSSETLGAAIRCVRKGGEVVLVGNLSPCVELPLQAVVTREISVLGSCASAGEYRACLEWMATGRIDVSPLISATAPLRDGAQWFQRLRSRETGLMKVMLQP